MNGSTEDEAPETNCHRHVNPDGSQGGWVSSNSQVDATAYVSPKAWILSHSRVTGQARILDQAQVFESVVQDQATLRDQSVANRCLVKDSAELSGDAAVSGSHLGPDGKTNVTIAGNTKICDLSIDNLNGLASLTISGGSYELPAGQAKEEDYRLARKLIGFAGAYDKQTGHVRIGHVGIGNTPYDTLTPLPNSSDLLEYIDYNVEKGLNVKTIGRISKSKHITDEKAIRPARDR